MGSLLATGSHALHEDAQIDGGLSLEASGDSGVNLSVKGPLLRSDSEAEIYVLKLKTSIQLNALIKGIPSEIINDDSQGGFVHKVFESVYNGLIEEYGTFIMEDERLILNIIDSQIDALWPAWQANNEAAQHQ